MKLQSLQSEDLPLSRCRVPTQQSLHRDQHALHHGERKQEEEKKKLECGMRSKPSSNGSVLELPSVTVLTGHSGLRFALLNGVVRQNVSMLQHVNTMISSPDSRRVITTEVTA